MRVERYRYPGQNREPLVLDASCRKNTMLLDLQEKISSLWQSKLGSKLIFSHLLVALGSLLIFMLVTSLAIQSYFANYQRKLVYEQSLYVVRSYENFYLSIGGSWNNFHGFEKQGDDPALLIVVDQSDNLEIFRVPSYLSLSQSEALDRKSVV